MIGKLYDLAEKWLLTDFGTRVIFAEIKIDQGFVYKNEPWKKISQTKAQKLDGDTIETFRLDTWVEVPNWNTK